MDPSIRKSLLAQACCQIPELCDFLDCEIDLIWECQEACNPQLQYYQTLLGLIEAAQIFARNQIDTSTKIAASNSQERFNAFSNSRSDMERDSSGRACSWSAATSQQYFSRNSQDSLVGYSESNSKNTASKNENGFDRSCRHTVGHGFQFSRVETTHTGRHGQAVGPEFGKSITVGGRTSNTQGGTNPLVPLTGLKYPPFTETGDFPYITVGEPGPLLPLVPANNSQEVCPFPNPTDPTPAPCQIGFPSLGQGYNGRWKISLAVPLVGEISWEWNRGFNERQYYHCTISRTNSGMNTDAKDRSIVTGTTDASERDNQSRSLETTAIAHLVRKYGISIRRGNSLTNAEEISRARGQGTAHSESERNSKANAYQQNRMKAESTRHSESHLRKTETAFSDEVKNKYGQISIHLSELWKRIWNKILILEKQFSAVPMGSKMNCVRSNTCCARELYPAKTYV